MALDKASTSHNETASFPHEPALLSAIALASLFSNCVEAFNLIRASQKWDHNEQLLLARIGIQQARLLIWGDVLGIASPPSAVTTSAVPKRPSAAYPDLKEPTFFGARDGRLEERDTRLEIEAALEGIVDRSSHLTREQMMEQFGLRPPKRTGSDYQPALDPTRLDAFREKYELLQEVAESYAHISARRSNSIALQAWTISDQSRFASFVALTREKIDFLVSRLNVSEQVDRAMRMDIRAFGWHLTADKARVAQDVSKLNLIAEACGGDYPQYLVATRQALENISREGREALLPDWHPAPNPRAGSKNPISAYQAPAAPLSPGGSIRPPKSAHSHAQGQADGGEKSQLQAQAQAIVNGQASPSQQKRPSLFGSFFKLKSFRAKSSGQVPTVKNPQKKSGGTGAQDRDPPRSVSDAGLPARYPGSGAGGTGEGMMEGGDLGDGAAMGRVRSKSVGAVGGFAAKTGVEGGHGLGDGAGGGGVRDVEEGIGGLALETVGTNVSRHDQFRGIGRVETRGE